MSVSDRGLRRGARPRLQVIVVTYNSTATLGRCLKGLESDHGAETQVVIVDNSPHDSTWRELLQTVSGSDLDVRTARSGANIGFARAVHLAMELGADFDADLYLLLNPDVVCTQTTVSEGVRRLGTDGIRVVTPVLVREDGSVDHACARNLPSIRSSLAWLLLRRGGYVVRMGVTEGEDTRRVPACSGAFMLMTAEDYRSSGGLDLRYWMYGEDLDLCRSLAGGEHPVGVMTDQVAVHLKGASSGGPRSVRVNYHFHRAMALYYLKWNGRSPRALSAAVVLGLGLRMVLVQVRLWAQAADLAARAGLAGRGSAAPVTSPRPTARPVSPAAGAVSP